MVRLDPRLRDMALKIARGYVRRLPRNVALEDVQQAALMGLVDGLRKHPGGEGARYECYLRMRIRGEIIDELRRQDWVGRRRRDATMPPPRIVHLDDFDEQWSDLLPSNDADPESRCITRLDAAKAWRTPLPERDRAVMSARYERGRHQKLVAEDTGVSEPRISQLESRALLSMRCALTGEPAPAVVPAATRSALRQQQIDAIERRCGKVA